MLIWLESDQSYGSKLVIHTLGQKLSVNDPNMGVKSFTYTDFGEVYSETDANGDSYYYVYDVLGRLSYRYLNVIPTTSNQNSSEASFSFDGTCNGAIDNEEREDLTGGESFSKNYSYDSYCRPESVTTNIDGNSFTSTMQYDGVYGRVKGSGTITGMTVKTNYNSFGYATSSVNASSGYVYQSVTDMNARLQLTAATQANGVLQQALEYAHETGQMELVRAFPSGGGNQRHRIDYEYDDFGNLASQEVENMRNNLPVLSEETYDYDDLHRLLTSTVKLGNTWQTPISYLYDAAGNFTKKDDFATTYTYGNLDKTAGGLAGPNAVRSINKVPSAGGGTATYAYDANGNMTSGDGRTMLYNAYNKPVSITKGSITSAFSYGSSQFRYKQVKAQSGQSTITTYYVDKAYEEIVEGNVTKKRLYLGDAIITQTIGGTEAGHTIGFVHRDRLNSVVTITDENGDVVDNKSFDPFGKPRKGTMERIDFGGILSTLELVRNMETTENYKEHTNRGFTDHEHLDDAQLIHMNGRVYDYNLGRFLSVDPLIQDPGNSQSLNPYTYILNNPLSGTDPSGYSPDNYDYSEIASIAEYKGGQIVATLKDGSLIDVSSVSFSSSEKSASKGTATGTNLATENTTTVTFKKNSNSNSKTVDIGGGGNSQKSDAVGKTPGTNGET